MKKFTAVILAVMICTLSACKKTETPELPTETEALSYENSETVSENNVINENSVAKLLSEEFITIVETQPDISAQALADRLLASPVISFSGISSAVSTGILTGFGNAEITGFSEGIYFAPVVNTIPFAGYIFVVDDNTDIQTFTDNLRANADKNWNVCTEADETVIATSGNFVFFVMAKNSSE